MYNLGVVSLALCRPRGAVPRRGVAQPGRAPGSGPGGRRFKSSLPDQCKSITCDSVEKKRVYKRVYIAAGTCGVGINSRHTLAAAMLTASTRSSHHVLL